jgi:acetylornithine deacetylase/succinyl-diaminopimelate desuccinylase-like protein
MGLVSQAPTGSPASYDPSTEVVDLCRELIRIDTTNPGDNSGPGERAAAEHVAELLEEVGIHAELYEPASRRTSVVARWGDVAGQEASPLLVHGHLDVVPADAADWQVDPFSGEVRDGCVWGRGAVDMKDFDAIVLSVVRARARAGVMPSRPLVLAFTADEEAGSTFGAEPLLRDKRGWFEDCDAAVGEVGGFSVTVRDQRMYLIQAAEKGMAWMRLTARGTAGHGSMRNPDNAVTRLAGAVARIGSHTWPVRLTPAMEVLLAAVGDIAGEQVTPDNAAALVEEFGPAARMLSTVIRNSASPTMFGAGYKVNVVPGKAVAHVDGRFLPGYEDEFFATLTELIGDGVDLDFVTRQSAVETDFAGRVPDAVTQALLAEDPDAQVLPYLMPGGTDGKQWARIGIACYGFAPLRLPADLDFTGLFHGIDERVPLDSLHFGARVFDRFLDLA